MWGTDSIRVSMHSRIQEFKKACLSANESICDDYLYEKIDTGGRLFCTSLSYRESGPLPSSLIPVCLTHYRYHGECSKTRRRKLRPLNARTQLDSCCRCDHHRNPPNTNSPQEEPWPTHRRPRHESIFGEPMPTTLRSWENADIFPRFVG